jgi:hypothetical protein
MSRLSPAEILLRATSETAFDAQLARLAALHGWRLSYHPWRSDHSAAGWPDRVWIRDERMVLVEEKRWNGQPTGEQCEWLAALRSVQSVEPYLLRPQDWGEALEIFE